MVLQILSLNYCFVIESLGSDYAHVEDYVLCENGSGICHKSRTVDFKLDEKKNIYLPFKISIDNNF